MDEVRKTEVIKWKNKLNKDFSEEKKQVIFNQVKQNASGRNRYIFYYSIFASFLIWPEYVAACT